MTRLPVKLYDDSIPPKTWVFIVQYSFRDGCHMFTSDAIPGLLIASRNEEKAFHQIAPTIEALIEEKHGIKFKAELGFDFKAFAKKRLTTRSDSCAISLQDTYVVLTKKAA